MKEGTESTRFDSDNTESSAGRSASEITLKTADELKRWQESREGTQSKGGNLAPDLRTTVWERYPEEYRPPTEADEQTQYLPKNRFEHPQEWVHAVNPGGPRGEFGYSVDSWRTENCGDCSRAVERNWRGDRQIAAGKMFGETNDRTEEWVSERFDRTDFAHIRARLEEAGHGASAIVGFDYPGGGGHFINAVNYEGQVLAVDGQNARVELWRRESGPFDYAVSEVMNIDGIVRDAEGRKL